MKLEYQNGVRITKLAHEMTALEAAMVNYEQMAEEQINRYGDMANKHYATDKTLTEEEREKELKEALRHLELERGRLKSISSVQGQLANYRAAGMMATVGTGAQRDKVVVTLKNEDHHPTDDLEKFMLAEGTPKPSSKHTAHHIVPGKGKDEVVTGNTRVHLHIHGIRINDPANGVYLLHKDDYTPHWSMPKSRGHLTYHTLAYEGWISRRLTRIRNIDFLKSELQVIGRILQDNEPKNIPGMQKR